MTKSETLQIVNRIRKLYMSQSRNYTDADWQMMTDTWYETFKDDKYDDVSNAVSLYVSRGKQFMPNVPDIIAEMTNLDEPRIKSLFERLKRECQKAMNDIQHVVVDDYGGIVRDPNSPTGFRYVVAEAHVTSTYTQSDFANMPLELQIYAEDIDGLKHLQAEIENYEGFAYKRFKESMPYLRQEARGAKYVRETI